MKSKPAKRTPTKTPVTAPDVEYIASDDGATVVETVQRETEELTIQDVPYEATEYQLIEIKSAATAQGKENV